MKEQKYHLYLSDDEYRQNYSVPCSLEEQPNFTKADTPTQLMMFLFKVLKQKSLHPEQSYSLIGKATA